MTSVLGGLDHRSLRLLDALVLFWAVLWVVLGGLTGYEVRELRSVSDSAEASARAADRAGEALQALRDLPIVGADAGELGDEVRTAADDVLVEAAESRTTVQRLGVLIGMSITLIPLTPVLWLYLPQRLARRSDVVALRRRWTEDPADPALTAYLARRAVDRLPYRDLEGLSRDPVGDLANGRLGALARAEAVRLGLPPGSS